MSDETLLGPSKKTCSACDTTLCYSQMICGVHSLPFHSARCEGFS